MGIQRIAMAVTLFSFSVSFGASAYAGCMDDESKHWLPSQRALYDKLMGLMTCPVDADNAEGRQVDAVGCNYFVAKALSEVYGVDDFTPDGHAGTWSTANEIADLVTKSPNWSLLGPANDQSTLANAAQGAANGQPVIAVIASNPNGHVALVLPGKLMPSSWKDGNGKYMNVPNSAAFSLDEVSKAYVFCRLSKTFTNATKDGVKLYWRAKAE